MKTKILAGLLILSVVSCGGGGGGGGEGGNKSSAATGVRIVHAAVDGSPLDVISSANPNQVVGSGVFAEQTFYGSLSTGEQVLTVALHNTPAVIQGTVPVTVEKNGHYSILFYGDEFQIGYRINVIDDNPGEFPEGMAAIKVIHGLVGASKVNAVFSGSQSEDGIEFGSASKYYFVPAGPNTVSAKRASDGAAVASVTSTFEAGKAYSLVLGGEIEYFKYGRIFED